MQPGGTLSCKFWPIYATNATKTARASEITKIPQNTLNEDGNNQPHPQQAPTKSNRFCK